ncbi:MAG: sugar phosphate permease [Spirochaetes bacterium]|nr:MAG: sugar phosphate permease [Spirochaetota bacterium]
MLRLAGVPGILSAMEASMQTPKNKGVVGIGILSVSHLLNDLYSNYLPQMLPFLMLAMPGFTVTKAAVLTSVFSITSSLIQPVFGYFVDNMGRRWLVHVGTLWMAIMLSLTGIVHEYWLLVILASLAGMGTAAFHPQASSMVNVLSGKFKAVFFSIFVAFGNIGFALGPLLLVPLFQAFGLKASLVTVIPGIVVTVLLYFFAPEVNISGKASESLGSAVQTLRKSSRELSAIVGVIAVRAMAYTGMLTLLPLYFQERNYSKIVASRLVTLMLASGALGGVLGGVISDRYGRKPLVVASLMLASPLFYLFLNTQRFVSLVFLAFAGMSLMSNFSVTIVAAQEVIPDNKALASGLTMGLAGGLGGLAVIFIGRIGDVWGLSTAISILFALPIAAGFVALFMPGKKRAATGA